MLKSVMAAGTAAVAASTFGVVGSASATGVGEHTPEINWFGHHVYVKRHDPDQAVVKVKYSCEGTGLHLWASVKQGPHIQPPDDTTSASARAWYETPDAAVPTCDGDAHVFRYTIYREDPDGQIDPQWKRLREGRAWAQFVIFYVPQGGDPSSPSRGAFSGWVKVETPHHRHHCGHHHGGHDS
ncbi:MAG: hypothetical protein QOF53_3419 [Nocardioidaceae bacterium]|nr:hypothetical protein [Nocardioidaceae bacterium]